MFTSYFGKMNVTAFKGRDLNWVCVAKGHRYYSGRCYAPLYPTWEMIKMEDEAEYERVYRRDILSKLDPKQVYEDLGEDAIIVCHEKYDDIVAGKTFCHRHIIARWLEEELGIIIPELVDTKQDLKSMLKQKKAEVIEDDSDWDDEDWDDSDWDEAQMKL